MVRLEKVQRIFQQFDLNKDGGLNNKELEALLVSTDSGLKDCSQDDISSGIDEVFLLYKKFIDGEKGLTCDGLLQIYDELGDGDLDCDYKAVGLKVNPHNDKEPAWDRYFNSKVWPIHTLGSTYIYGGKYP